MHPAVESGRAAAYAYACRCANGRVTSDEIASVVGVNATLVRRDLSQMFGRSGKRGVGYDAAELEGRLRDVASQSWASGGALLIAAAAERGAFGGDGELADLVRQGALIACEIDRRLGIASVSVSPSGRAES